MNAEFGGYSYFFKTIGESTCALIASHPTLMPSPGPSRVFIVSWSCRASLTSIILSKGQIDLLVKIHHAYHGAIFYSPSLIHKATPVVSFRGEQPEKKHPVDSKPNMT